jgi:predicted nicotinamide N-methyase
MSESFGDLFDVSSESLIPLATTSRVVRVQLGDECELALEQSEHLVAETGGLVWASGVELAHWLREHRAALQGAAFASIVDLGCGSGVAGLAAALLLPGVPDVCLCDYDRTALALAQRNAVANGLEARCRTVSATFQQCADDPALVLGSGGAGRVLILASDVCYDEQSEQGLVAALAALLDCGRSARVVVSVQKRGDLHERLADVSMPLLARARGLQLTSGVRWTADTHKEVLFFDLSHDEWLCVS